MSENTTIWNKGFNRVPVYDIIIPAYYPIIAQVEFSWRDQKHLLDRI